MITLGVVAATLAACFYVALRRATPNGVAVDPWPYLLRLSREDRFVRNVPEPGDELCGASPPSALILQQRDEYGRVMTTCVRPRHATPEAARRGAVISHNSLAIDRDGPDGIGGMMHYTWLDPTPRRDPAVARRRPRWTWWRRLLVRIATP